MTQPALTANPAVPAAKNAGLPSLEERVAVVNAEMDASSEARGITPPGDAHVETATPAKPDVTEAVNGVINAPVAPVDDGAAARAAERRARLDAVTNKTRDQVDRKAALAQADKAQRDLAAAQARAEAAEAQAASRVDVSSLDEAAFFALAEQKGIKPDALSAWMIRATTSPEKIAEAAALQATRTAYDPKMEAYEKRLAAQDEQIAAMAKERAVERAQAEEHRATQHFLGMVQQSAERAPLAARLLATDHHEFMQMAEIAAERVPGMGPQALLDAVEELLDGDGRAHAVRLATLYGLTTAPEPSQPTAPTTPTPQRGAAKPKTVSNSLAQGRTTLVDEQDFAKLPLEERAAILKRS